MRPIKLNKTQHQLPVLFYYAFSVDTAARQRRRYCIAGCVPHSQPTNSTMKRGPLLVLVSSIRQSTAYIKFLVTHRRIPSNECVRRLSHPLQLCHLSCPCQDLPLTVVVFWAMVSSFVIHRAWRRQPRHNTHNQFYLAMPYKHGVYSFRVPAQKYETFLCRLTNELKSPHRKKVHLIKRITKITGMQDLFYKL